MRLFRALLIALLSGQALAAPTPAATATPEPDARIVVRQEKRARVDAIRRELTVLARGLATVRDQSIRDWISGRIEVLRQEEVQLMQSEQRSRRRRPVPARRP